ncbi:hypothetical protein PSPO01_14054 [Paraphaeosphaeria sporulosa]
MCASWSICWSEGGGGRVRVVRANQVEAKRDRLEQKKHMIKVRKKGIDGTSTRQIQKRVPVQHTRTCAPPVSVLLPRPPGFCDFDPQTPFRCPEGIKHHRRKISSLCSPAIPCLQMPQI